MSERVKHVSLSVQRNSFSERFTAVVEIGRKNNVTAAIVFIESLSLRMTLLSLWVTKLKDCFIRISGSSIVTTPLLSFRCTHEVDDVLHSFF